MITNDWLQKIAKSLAIYITNKKKNPKILLAGDTRVSTDMIINTLCNVFVLFGINIVYAGIMPTPAVYYLTKNNKFDMGIMITASHNTGEYNGIKIITSQGCCSSDEMEQEITNIFHHIDNYTMNKVKLGKVTKNDSLIYEWANKIIKTINCSLRGMKVALDCANGASYKIAPYIFRKLGADILVINDSSNGRLINRNCGSLHLEQVSKFAQENNCQLGFAFDGDADRVNVCLGNGKQLSGVEMIFVICWYLRQNNKINKNTIVTTINSNKGLILSLNKIGVQSIITSVGTKYIQTELLKKSLSFGAEDSGHLIWANFNNCASGIMTAVMLCKIFKRYNNFNEILKNLEIFKQVNINVLITQLQKDNFVNGLFNPIIERFNKKLRSNERIVVRPSGTEPLMRILVESDDVKRALKISKQLEQKIKEL